MNAEYGHCGSMSKDCQVIVQSEDMKDIGIRDGESRNNGELGHSVGPIVANSLSKAFIFDIMSVPSVSGKEGLMKEFIRQFAEERDIGVMEDQKGNIYLTKGELGSDEYYPCLVNHMDTVQRGQEKYVDDRKRLTISERQRNGRTELFVEGMGIGADDKLGCAIALALIDQLSAVKAAFFVEEEKGMLGSKELDLGWFKDVGFCLSFDSPGRDRSSRTCAGATLYSEDFFSKVLKPVCDRHGITNFYDEPYTDIVQIRQKTPIMCYNVGNGGYRAHCQDEYLVVEDAQAAYAFGKDLLEVLK